MASTSCAVADQPSASPLICGSCARHSAACRDANLAQCRLTQQLQEPRCGQVHGVVTTKMTLSPTNCCRCGGEKYIGGSEVGGSEVGGTSLRKTCLPLRCRMSRLRSQHVHDGGLQRLVVVPQRRRQAAQRGSERPQRRLPRLPPACTVYGERHLSPAKTPSGCAPLPFVPMSLPSAFRMVNQSTNSGRGLTMIQDGGRQDTRQLADKGGAIPAHARHLCRCSKPARRIS